MKTAIIIIGLIVNLVANRIAIDDLIAVYTLIK